MVFLMVGWMAGTLELVLLASVFPGFRVADFQSAVFAASVVALFSAAIATVLRGIVSWVTTGISAVLLAVADALLFRLVALIVMGFAMRAFYPAVAGAVLLVGTHLAMLKVWRMMHARETAGVESASLLRP